MTIRAYRRISVDAAESQSLGQQEHLIQRWAEFKHPGVEVEWYADPGVSGGTPLASRPDGARLLRDLRKGDVIVVIKIDRLARSVRDLLDTVEACEKAGAAFVATEQDVSTEGAYGRFMITLLGALAELERDIVSERIKAARAEFLRNGRYGVGRLPWGFTAVRDLETGWLRVRPDPVDGPKLREAVLAVINGATQVSQAEKLGMSEPSFRGLLTNVRLYGQTPGDGGKLDPHAALITMTQWQSLQALIGRPRAWTRAPGYAAALECYGCGTRTYFNEQDGGKRDTYRCSSKNHPGRAVILRRIADEYLEDWFLSRYGHAEIHLLVREGDDGERLERLAGIEVELEKLGRKVTMRGADTVALLNDIDELQRQRDIIEAEPVRGTTRSEPTGRTVADHWTDADDAERTRMLQRAARFVLWPRGHEGGRIEAIPRPGEPGGKFTITPADLEWLEEQGLT